MARYKDREALQARIPRELNRRIIADCKKQLRTKTAIIRDILENNIKVIEPGKSGRVDRESLFIYVPAELKKQVQEYADKSEVSMSFYIESILKSHYKEETL